MGLAGGTGVVMGQQLEERTGQTTVPESTEGIGHWAVNAAGAGGTADLVRPAGQLRHSPRGLLLAPEDVLLSGRNTSPGRWMEQRQPAVSWASRGAPQQRCSHTRVPQLMA